MKKFFKKVRKFFRRNPNNFAYALAFHKVSRRLGVARSNNRQLRNENAYLADEVIKLRRALIERTPSFDIDKPSIAA